MIPTAASSAPKTVLHALENRVEALALSLRVRDSEDVHHAPPQEKIAFS